MLDRYNREITYLRISVTDRCNLRCVYCMPEDGIELLEHADILSYDEITAFTRVAAARGVRKVKFTGGEPLVRRGVSRLVSMIASIEGITDISMTTNGILLPEYAGELKEAGLQRVNISLDTVNPSRYRELTRIGELEDVLKGIDAAIDAGLAPVKINCVVRQSSGERDAREVSSYGTGRGLEVRFIQEMTLSSGSYGIVHGGSGGDCSRCNRLRLTSDGKLKPCLFSDVEADIIDLGYNRAIDFALEHKPLCGTINEKGYFYNIGG